MRRLQAYADKETRCIFENNKFHVIPNSERQILSVNHHKKKQILFVGRFTYVDKRVDRLIDVWKRIYKEVPDWELLLIGDGAERQNLQQKATACNLQRIRFWAIRKMCPVFIGMHRCCV